jgi:hypothetical protein
MIVLLLLSFEIRENYRIINKEVRVLTIVLAVVIFSTGPSLGGSDWTNAAWHRLAAWLVR